MAKVANVVPVATDDEQGEWISLYRFLYFLLVNLSRDALGNIGIFHYIPPLGGV